MQAEHFEILVEDRSTEAFLHALLGRFLPHDQTFGVRTFAGKQDILKKMEGRLRGYKHWPDNLRIIVLLDCDNDDCMRLKARMEHAAQMAELPTASSAADGAWRVANRIAVEELEAWYFGNWRAVRAAFPRVPANTDRKQGYRDSDKISGGTWEAFERIMNRSGYFKGGLNKIEAAQKIGGHIVPEENSSPSFQVFMDALRQ